MSRSQIEETQIAEAAFFLWLNEGKPEGREEAHWHQARVSLEGELAPVKPRRAARTKATGSKTTAPKTAAAKPKATRTKAAAAKASTTKTTAAPAKRRTAAPKTAATE